MKTRILSIAAIALWTVTIGVVVFFMVKGQTETTSDNRRAVNLTAGEKAVVLMEMRGLLKSVQGIVDGVATSDRQKIIDAARASGMRAAADVNPSFMMKLPLDFKQRGIGLHKSLDKFADDVEGGLPVEQVIPRLNSELKQCIACHEDFQLNVE